MSYNDIWDVAFGFKGEFMWLFSLPSQTNPTPFPIGNPIGNPTPNTTKLSVG